MSELLNLELVCDICGQQFKTTSDIKVDHNHATEEARGLLCNTCNAGLGMFRDSPTLLIKATRYLLRHGAAEKLLNPPDIPETTNDHLVFRGHVTIGATLVQRMAQFETSGDLYRSIRNAGFPQGRALWIKTEVLAWIKEHREQLERMRQQYAEQRHASAVRKQAKLRALTGEDVRPLDFDH